MPNWHMEAINPRDNETAIALYRRSGFQLLDKRPAYYPETGEDALVMEKQLKENL